MEILAIEHDGPDVVTVTPALLRAEAARVYELEQAGTIRRTWFRADCSAAVLLVEATSAEDAERSLATLPLVVAGAITFELVPLGPYPGLARLWSESAD